MSKPNIVLMHAHNTGKFIQPYGFDVPTPRIQQLAEQGVLFRKAFTVGPTCSPSRACLMTGQYPHTNGMLGLAHRGFALHDYSKTLVHTFNDAGYETVLAGLQHIARERAMLGYSRDLNTDGEKDKGEAVAKRAIKYLSSKPDGPFFLDVGINESHRGYLPATEADDERYKAPPPGLPDHPDVRKDVAEYCATARVMDRVFGEVIDAIDENGFADNTIVICLSDHGLQFPMHMCNLTDRGIETFFVMRGPSEFTGGKVIDPVISHMDLFPTLCDIVDIDTPDWVQGKSFLPLVKGEIEKLHEDFFAEITYHAAYEAQRCVRTDRYKYIRRYDNRERIVMPNIDRGYTRNVLLDNGIQQQPRWQEALFDLVFDPQEANNRIDDPTLADVADELRGKLDKWMKETDDLMQSGEQPFFPGLKYCHPDGMHPMDRVLEYPG